MKNELVKSNNSAGRVYRILATAKELDSKGSALAGWARIFSLNPTDEVGVFVRLTAMQQEMARARSEFERRYKFGGVHHDPIPKLVLIIQQANLQQQWQQLVQQIDSASMSALGLIAKTLPADSPGAEVSDDDLGELVKKVDELVSETLAAGLDDGLCRIIVERLHAIKTAILMYKVYGNHGLDDAVQSTIGSVILNRDSLANKAPPGVIKKLGKLLEKIRTLIHTADEFRGLASILAGLLTG